MNKELTPKKSARYPVYVQLSDDKGGKLKDPTKIIIDVSYIDKLSPNYQNRNQLNKSVRSKTTTLQKPKFAKETESDAKQSIKVLL